MEIIKKIEIVHFVSSLFWRNPKSNSVLERIIKNVDDSILFEYLGFKFEQESNIFLKDKLQESEFVKVAKHLIPNSNIFFEEVKRLTLKWKTFNHFIEGPYFIVGDNPILINNNNLGIENIFNEIIIPLGRHRLLTLVSKSPNFLDSMTINNINLSIFHQSERFIATDSEFHIRCLLADYNHFTKNSIDIVKHTFDFINYQSQFATFDDYLDHIQLLKFSHDI